MLGRPFSKRPRPMGRHHAPGHPAPRDDREGEAAADEIFPIAHEIQILLIPAMAAMLRAGHAEEYAPGSHRFLEGRQPRRISNGPLTRKRCSLIPLRDRDSVSGCRGVDPVLQQKCIQRSLRSDPTQPRPASGRGFLLASQPSRAIGFRLVDYDRRSDCRHKQG